jgi:pilus assembly protein CpaC
VTNRVRHSACTAARSIIRGFLLLFLGLVPASATGQQILSQAQRTVQIQRGASVLLRLDSEAVRISIADPAVADIISHTAREHELLGRAIGTTTMIVWQVNGVAQLYTIEVSADIGPLQDQIRTLFPNANITVTTSGNAILLSGAVRDPGVVRRVLQLAEATGAPVINNIQAPTAEQILLHVRFAEIGKSALARLSADMFFQNLGNVEGVVSEGQRTDLETLSSGIVRLFLIGRDAELDAVIRALRSNGEFRSLAEPNLITLEGQEATFLAGGELPIPAVQGGTAGASNAVTIQFKEFGVRLSFTPHVTPSGTIRLRVAPEVSSLDFANALTISGFSIPALLTRRVETNVELAPGQHLAIAGLLDNSQSENIDKIPLLGDLPIIGALFRSREKRQDRTELLVLVTPHIVEPTNLPIPLPTGEPGTWQWDRRMQPDTVNRTLPQVRRGGNSP